jgi:hypothetical protein
MVSEYFANSAYLPNSCPLEVLRVPEGVVSGVFVNPDARDLLADGFKSLASEEYLVWNSYVVHDGGGEKQGIHSSGTVYSPSRHTRSIFIDGGIIPYGENMWGNYVYVKGVGQSGKCFPWKNTGDVDSATPWGFFGSKDAQAEVDVANTLLKHNFFSQLPLGYVTLDSNKCLDLIDGTTRNANRHKAVSNLRKVIANGDKPAILFRLTSSPVRFDQVLDGNKHGLDTYIKHIGLLLSQAGAERINAFIGGTYKRHELRKMIRGMSEGKPKQDERQIYIEMLRQIAMRNHNALKNIYESQGYIFDLTHLAEPKDIDVLGMTGDYELCKAKVTDESHIDSWLERMESRITEVSRKIKSHVSRYS